MSSIFRDCKLVIHSEKWHPKLYEEVILTYSFLQSNANQKSKKTEKFTSQTPIMYKYCRKTIICYMDSYVIKKILNV